FVERILADRIIDDRQLLALSDLSHSGDEILAPIDDRMIATVLLDERCLFIVADRADHGSAKMLCPLADDQSDTTGRGMDQDCLAALHGMSATHQVPGGHA